MLSAAFLNGLRRALAEQLEASPVNAVPLRKTVPDTSVMGPEDLSYKTNIANSADRAIYSSRGAESMEAAYELTHRPGAELMRSRYCVRYELGLCPKSSPSALHSPSSVPQSSSSGTPSPSSSGLSRGSQPLYLVNNGRRLRLRFHCPTCEMTVEDC